MTRLTWPDGFYVTYDYDPAGRVTAIRENGAASGIGVLASYSYDGLGKRLGINRGNGTAESYGYDAIGRMVGMLQELGGTGNTLTISPIAYNPASQITNLTRSNDLYAWTGHYNRNTAETPNGLNQLITQGATALSYDARGNVSAVGATGYNYTAENRLASSGNAYLAYEPGGGQLLQMVQGGVDTRFGWSENRLVAEISGTTGALLRRYVHGPGADEPLVWYEGSGTSDRRWLHADERGSIVAVSNASGNALAINKYDEYGNPAAANLGRFGYTGQTWLPELGLWNYKARIYNPKLGRFMQTDPIGYKDGINGYAYVGNDPISAIDPSGLARVCADRTDSLTKACVNVDGDGNGNARENDLSKGQVRQLSNHFSAFIAANRGANLSSYGKSVSGSANNADQSMTRAVSQFVGKALSQVGGVAFKQWKGIDSITANSRINSKGDAAGYRAHIVDGKETGTGHVWITGYAIKSYFSGRYLYDSPSNMARALFHESGHVALGRDSESSVDFTARARLGAFGLDGGGCWAIGYNPLGGCW